jgi:hypothetical protein
MFSPSSYTFACINWIIYTLYTYRIGFMVVKLLSPALISCHTSLPSFMILSMACVFVRVFGLPPVVMWGDYGEDRCCGLSKGLEWWRLLRPSWHVVARICYGPNIRSRHTRTICATTLVWNDFLTNKEGSSELSCWKSGNGMAIPTKPQGARGAWG